MENPAIDDAIIKAFETINETLLRLAEHIKDRLSNFPVWIDNQEGEFVSDRHKVIEVLKHFRMSEGLTPQETFACVGVVACIDDTLPLIAAVNKAKDKFKTLVDLYLQHCQADKSRNTAVIRNLLAVHGYPQLKIRQIYRHIHVINYHPRRISFSQAIHRSHRIITRSQAEHLLKTIGQGENIEIQLTKLQTLGTKEKLVIRHHMQAVWIANVTTFKNATGRSVTKLQRSAIPIFYVHNNQLPMPHVVFSKKNERKVSVRADKQLEEAPFLPSIRAYRYIHA